MTRRWREMDSNFQYASTVRWHRATDLLLPPTVKRRSAGRPPPMARPRSEAQRFREACRRHAVHPSRNAGLRRHAGRRRIIPRALLRTFSQKSADPVPTKPKGRQRRDRTPILSRSVAPEMPSPPCSSEAGAKSILGSHQCGSFRYRVHAPGRYRLSCPVTNGNNCCPSASPGPMAVQLAEERGDRSAVGP